MDTKLTTKSQEALSAAIADATAAGNPQLEPVHVLQALLAQEGGVAAALLDAVGADRAALTRQVEGLQAALPGAYGSSVSQPQMSRALLTAVNAAQDEAKAIGDEYVTYEHIMLVQAVCTSGVCVVVRVYA